MAEPARKLYDKEDEESFYQASSGRQKFGVIEGGGEGDGKPTGDLRSVPDAGEGSNAEDENVDSYFDDMRANAQKEAESLYQDNRYPKGTHKNKKVQGYASRRFKKWAIGGAAGMSIAAAGAIFSLIPTFQLDNFFQNVNASAFLRYNSIFDGRSSKWLDAYMKARLFEIKGGDITRDNLYFRANRVDTNSPFTDWYRTMRTSSFENDLIEKHGMRFTSGFELNADGSLKASRFATIELRDLDNLDVDIDELLEGSGLDRAGIESAFNNGGSNNLENVLNSLSTSQQDKLFNIDFGKDDSAKSARKRIRSIVNDEVPWYRAIRRRSLRKNLTNMLGVREWRFFEGTRASYAEHKVNFQKKLIDRTFGQLGNKGKLIACMMGASCPRSGDIAAPENQASGRYAGDANDPDFDNDDTNTCSNSTGCESGSSSNADPDNPGLDENGNPINEDRGDFSDGRTNAPDAPDKAVDEVFDELTPEEAAKLLPGSIKKILSSKLFAKLNLASGIVDTMDMLVSLHNNLKAQKLTKVISLGRIAEAAAVYTTYQLIADQINSGGELTAEEAGVAVESIEGFAASEAYQTLILNKAQNLTDEQRDYWCSPERLDEPENREIAERVNCVNLGAGDTNAARVEEAYNRSIGPIMNPIAATYNGVRNLPLIGGAIDWVQNTVSVIGDKITTAALSFVGLDDDVERLAAWFQEKIGGWFGMAPLLDGTEGGAKIAGFIIAGGVATSETALRYSGAAASSLLGAEETQYEYALVNQYRQNEYSDMNLKERWLDLRNYRSFAAKSLAQFGGMTSTFSSNPLGTIIASIKMPFIGSQVHAEALDPNAPADFFGMQTFSFPVTAYNSDPADMKLGDCTNADTRLGISLTWDLVTSDQAFYEEIHAVAANRYSDDRDYDDAVNSIWNICLMDQQIRSGYALKYGGAEGGNTTASSSSNNTSIRGDTFDIPCATGTRDLGDSLGLGYDDGEPYRIRICEIGGIRINSTISEQFLVMYNAALEAGVTLTATESFRTMERQEYFYNCFVTQTCNDGNRAAAPGYSNHQMGLAIDFELTPAIRNFLETSPANFLQARVAGEPWHYSLSGY